MKHFAGLDVSPEETAICVVDGAGGIVREARVPSEPEALVAYFRGLGLPMERIGLEACSLAAWLHEGLAAAGLPAVCIETRRAKAAMGAMPNKTDRNDARGLAQIIRTGWYRAVHVKSPVCRSWRALLATRRLVLNKLRDVENGLRASLREAGLKLGTPGRKRFPDRVRELTAADPVLSALAEPLLTIIAAMTRELARLTKQILDIVRGEPVCRRLMGVPGVGPLTALTFPPPSTGPTASGGRVMSVRTSASRPSATSRARPTCRPGSAAAATSSPGPRSTRRRTRSWSAAGSGPPCAPGACGSPGAAAWREPASPSPASPPPSCTGCGPTARTSAGARRARRRPPPERIELPPGEAEPCRSRGDDGRGDPAESPEPRGSRPEGRHTDWDAHPPDPLMRRPRADRGEKRVTHGRGRSEERLASQAPIREGSKSLCFLSSLEAQRLWPKSLNGLASTGGAGWRASWRRGCAA